MPENQPYIIPVSGVTASQLSNTWKAPRSGGRQHAGIDIFAPEGTPVVSSVSGEVVRAGTSGKAGKRVWVRGNDGKFYFYAHLASIGVQEGQKVTAGQSLGGVGKTGNAANTPPHLHFSVNSTPFREDGQVNPYQLLTGGKTVDTISTGQTQYQQDGETAEDQQAVGPPSGEQMLTSVFDAYADIIAGGKRSDYRTVAAGATEDIEPAARFDDDEEELTPGTRPQFEGRLIENA